MKKALLVITALYTTLFSNTQYKFANHYFVNGGTNTPELQKLLKKDINFRNGNEYLQNPSKMITKDINYADPETVNAKPVMKTESFPDWAKALEQFKKSVETSKNPVSAYEGLHIIKTVYGKNAQVKAFSQFSEILYNKAKNICTSFLDYGETLENGYYRKKDLNKALTVYTEGLNSESCKKGWYQNVISAKVLNLKKKAK